LTFHNQIKTRWGKNKLFFMTKLVASQSPPPPSSSSSSSSSTLVCFEKFLKGDHFRVSNFYLIEVLHVWNVTKESDWSLGKKNYKLDWDSNLKKLSFYFDANIRSENTQTKHQKWSHFLALSSIFLELSHKYLKANFLFFFKYDKSWKLF